MPTIIPVRRADGVTRAEMPGAVAGLPTLPPAPTHAGAGMRRFDRLYAWGIGIVVAAIIVPQYLYLFTCYLDGPIPLVVHACIAPVFAAGSVVALAVLIATPIRLWIHLRARRDHPVTPGPCLDRVT